MVPVRKRRISFLVIIAALLLAALCVIWLVRGRNSPPIAAKGGESFQNVATIETPFHLQRDPRWRNETIGGTGETLSKVGCTVSSLAMALEHYGIRLTPAQLNDWLKTNGGYTWRGWLKWGAVSAVAEGKVSVAIVPKPTHADIDGALKQSQPVMVKVLINRVVPHWVLIVGKTGQEYLIHDPLGDGQSAELLSKYGSDIYGVRVVKPSG
jgi:hypothetical protein